MAGSETFSLKHNSSGDHNDKRTQKNKGGRKLIYATKEERKKRNREAQAALRERRTEYITELEKKIDAMKNELAKNQTASSTLTDRYLMLRYKNSLLERILLERGVDIQAELDMKANPNQFERSDKNKKNQKSESNAQQVPRPAEIPRAIPKPIKHLEKCRCRFNCYSDHPIALESSSEGRSDQFTYATPMDTPPQINAVEPIQSLNKRRRDFSPNVMAAQAPKCSSCVQNPVPYQFPKHSACLGKFSPFYIAYLFYGILAVLD